MTCEKCSAIFSRKKCLHENCPSHREELAVYQRRIDNHIHKMVVQAWYPRTKALEVQPLTRPKTTSWSRAYNPRKSTIVRRPPRSSSSPRENQAVGDVLPPRNHKQTFSAPAAPPNDKAPGILLPAQLPIHISPLAQPGQSARLSWREGAGSNPAGALVGSSGQTRL